MKQSGTILVVAAHPDDEVLGCGATIAKLSPERETHIAILGEGVTSRYADRAQSTPALEKLCEDGRAVAAVLGARSVIFEGLPDNRFDQLPLLDVIKKVEALVDRFRPQTIFTHHSGDLNVDHAITFRAVMTATRPMSDCPVEEIYAFEVGSSTEWAFQRFEPAFRPNTFIDVSGTIATKLKAMALYESEVRSFPHPRSAEALEIQARRWGVAVGLEHAEAFELVRAIQK